MMTDRKTISIMKACELVGVSRRTIYNWIASGKVEYVRTAGGSVRIFRRHALARARAHARADQQRSLMTPAADPRSARTSVDEPPDLGLLFHRLNNQLGIILANAELLEAKVSDDMTRARASQVVASVLDAMSTAREIRTLTKTDPIVKILTRSRP